MISKSLALGVLMVVAWLGLAAAQPSEDLDALEQRLAAEAAAEAKALAVNEGELRFLAQPPAKAVHSVRNRLTLTRESLETGFVALYQCHAQLDAVPEAQVVYRYQRMRKLHIVSQRGIDKTWVAGASVQMVGIHKGARLCVRAEVAVLHADAGGGYTLRSGPFHRRFLDGYYPMHVVLDLRYPRDLLQFAAITPPAQPGLHVTHGSDGMQVDAWFEGQLTLEVRFIRPSAAPP
jgi:hypothetical protein